LACWSSSYTLVRDGNRKHEALICSWMCPAVEAAFHSLLLSWSEDKPDAAAIGAGHTPEEVWICSRAATF
jgi:hypothetical protein